MITVVSTGLLAPTKQRCIDSVASQTHEHRHVYVEAGIQEPRLCALENFTNVVRTLDPKDIVVSLDGDDWFPDEKVLTKIAEVYADPNVWITYGSFVFADGRPGFAAPYETDDIRKAPWQATHLKTFRAALFHKLGDAELKRDGQYRDLAWDMATMFPMLEMAGVHARFLPDVLYVYNFGHSWEHNASREEREREARMNAEIRGLPRKERLTSL